MTTPALAYWRLLQFQVIAIFWEWSVLLVSLLLRDSLKSLIIKILSIRPVLSGLLGDYKVNGLQQRQIQNGGKNAKHFSCF
jgi:hypothetical protein